MKKKDELVSIIIPIYNVSKYLEECVGSVIKQTYTNIEIILVDDGSTDESGIICDRYSMQDTRIKVIHKKNGGLSDARNVGIKNAEGNYLLFVDSDDYVHEQFVEIMLNEMLTNNVDLVVCAYNIVDDNGEFMRVECDDLQEQIKTEKAVLFLLEDKYIKNYAWNKLYKKELFKDIQFPVGKLFEDIYTTYKVFLKCENISLIKNGLYYYRQRPGSIMQGVNMKREIDSLESKCERYKKLNLIYPQYKSLMLDEIIDTFCCVYAVKSKLKNKAFDNKINKTIEWINTEMKKYKSKLPFKRRLIFKLICKYPQIMCSLFQKKAL